MQYEIFFNGELINTIESDEDFCKEYCDSMGYTYQLREQQNPEPTPEPETPTYTEEQLLGQDITALHQEQIEMGQEITELQLNQLEGGATANA